MAAAQMKELCYGKGYAMIDGKMVPLGMCIFNNEKVPRSPVVSDNATPKDYFGRCMNKKNAYITRLNPNAQNNQN